MNNAKILDRAKEIALAQGGLGDSPASWKDGNLHLCAASCIARAAVEVSGSGDNVDEFNSKILSLNGRDYLREIFVSHDIELDCESVVQRNDNIQPDLRLGWFQELIVKKVDKVIR